MRDVGQLRSKFRLNFRKANFQLFKAVIDGMPWETAFRVKEVDQSWQVFKEVFNRVPEITTTKSKTFGNEDKSQAWLNWGMLVKLKGKKKCSGS